jgi:hypothetical protein
MYHNWVVLQLTNDICIACIFLEICPISDNARESRRKYNDSRETLGWWLFIFTTTSSPEETDKLSVTMPSLSRGTVKGEVTRRLGLAYAAFNRLGKQGIGKKKKK